MKTGKAIVTFLQLITLAGFLASVSLAQSDRGRITGTVMDANKGVLIAAKITVKNLETGVTQETATSSDGVYTVPQLKAGRYTVSVEVQGFKTATRSGVTVDVNGTHRLDFTMEVGEITQTVDVTADAPPLQADTAEVGQSITRRQVIELPLEVGGGVTGGRSAEAFAFLTPGVSGNVFQSRVNGGQNFSNEILLDGASTWRSENGGSFDETAPSPNAFQEFKIQTSTYSAEFGRTGGGITSFTIKSGTNQLHGEVYELLRNRVLDANSFFSNRQGRDANGNELAPRGIDTQNDFGFNVGGPILIPKVYDGRNKTFFFFNYEGYRFNIGDSHPVTIPTLKMRQGDFSELLDPNLTDGFGGPKQMYDPFTSGRPAFPGNILPSNRESAVAKNILALYPTPTFTDRVFQNYIATSNRPLNVNSYTIKIDHSLSNKSKLSGSYSYRFNDRIVNFPVLPHPLEDPFSWPQKFKTRFFRLSHDYNFSPTLLNHFTFGLNRTESGNNAFSFGEPWPEQLGLKGVPNLAFPRIFYAGPTFPYQLSGNNFIEQTNDTGFTYVDTLSWVKGKHNLKFGVDFRRQRYNPGIRDDINGTLQFPARYTSPGAFDDANGGDAIASLFLGAAESPVRTEYTLSPGWRQQYLGFFIQDDYKVTPRLTLNLGFRYEIPSPRVEVLDRFRAFAANVNNLDAGNHLGALVRAGENGQNRTFINPDRKEFSPRLGFAYSLNDKTVLRGGYGIFYTALFYNEFGQYGAQGFNTTRAFIGVDDPAFRLDDGFPPIAINPNDQLIGGDVDFYDPSFKPGYTQNWSLDVQRELAQNLVLTVSYVGTKGTRLKSDLQRLDAVNPEFFGLGYDLLSSDINSPAAQTAGISSPYPGFVGSVSQALKTYPQYNSIIPRMESLGNSTYHSMQVKAEKRFSQGLNLLASYTWSKTLTSAGSNFGSGGFTASTQALQNSFDRRSQKAVADQDIPHTLVVSYIYELPFGKGKPFLSKGGIVDKLVGGWQVGGVHRYQKGEPISLVDTRDDGLLYTLGMSTSLRPNVEPGQPLFAQTSNFDPDKGTRLNPDAFTHPLSIYNAPPGLDPKVFFGSAPRAFDYMREFNLYNEDINILKRFHIHEQVSLEFRTEFFNTFNRVRFGRPHIDRNDGAFGVIDGLGNIPRRIQFGLKIVY